MARGGTNGTPYTAVVVLWGWATAVWAYIDGKLLLAGIEAMQVPAARLLNIVFAVMVDSVGEVNRGEVIERLDTYLLQSDVPDRDRWGTDPAYVQRQRGIMGQYGPPPGWTPKPKD